MGVAPYNRISGRIVADSNYTLTSPAAAAGVRTTVLSRKEKESHMPCRVCGKVKVMIHKVEKAPGLI